MDKEWQLLNLNETTTDMAQVTDTVSLAMKLCPGHQVNLDNLCNLYDVDRSARTIHGALLDAQILAEVYLAMTGGQGSLEFSDAQAKAKKVWQRPNGAKLPLMQVEDEMMCVHIDKMISLSQARPLVKKEGEPPMAGSTWSHDYDMPYLEKGEDESKGDYKKRLKEQKLEMMDKLLNKEQQEMLKAYQEREQKAYKEWEDRVLGNTK